MACFQAVRTKLPYTSYKRLQKPVSHGVLKAYNFFLVKLETDRGINRIPNLVPRVSHLLQGTGRWETLGTRLQDICTWITFESDKSPVFLFFYFCFLLQIVMNLIPSLILQYSSWFLCFPLKFRVFPFSYENLRKIGARAATVDPLRMPDIWLLCFVVIGVWCEDKAA